jgi:tetratricopeptide (TPR) repeat protein
MQHLLFTLTLYTASLLAQTVQSTRPPEDPLAALTPEQRQTFIADATLFNAGKFPEALAGFRALLANLPDGLPAHILTAKFAAEASLNMGDRPYAFALLKPIEAANPDDWQARSLLARYYAENGDKAQRDAELVALVALHKADPQSQIGKLTQFLLERDTLSNGGSVRIWYSLEPWGNFKAYISSRIFDKDGNQVLRVTLESSDFDQPMFVKEHPDLAAKGDRRFSMDGYGPDQKMANGNVTQTHMLFGFFDGRPSYDVVRERIIAIAEGKKAPLSRTDPGLPR